LLWQYGVEPLGLKPASEYLLLLLFGGTLIALAAWGFWYLAERPFLNSRPTQKPSLVGSEGVRDEIQDAAQL
jgi:hypothetical protein